MESIVEKAIGWFKDKSEATKELTSGNVSHKACAIRGLANGSAEYLEECKGNLSVIKWQTGEPTEDGTYLAVYEINEYRNDVITLIRSRSKWRDFFFGKVDKKRVLAWCKLSDIEPYKEEIK